MDESRAPDVLRGLTGAQRSAVTHEAGVLCVLAGAGSGKTTVLTRRVAWRVRQGTAHPSHALVVTFTRRAAAELRGRLGGLGVQGAWAGTLHGAAYAQLRRHWDDAERAAPTLVADGRRLLRAAMEGEGRDDPDAVASVLGERSWAAARGHRPDAYPEAAAAAGRRTKLPAEQVAEVLRRYDEEKRRRRVVDLDDLLVLAADLADAEPEATAWRVRHLFVDEFQDLNPAQWRLIEAWRRGREDLCVVGDPRQAVYTWNGSDPTLLGRLPTLISSTRVVRLDDNHRCTPQVMLAAGAALAGEEHPPKAASDREGPLPVLAGFDDEAAEARAVVRWLVSVRRPGNPWSHAVVLARTNARLESVAEALRRAGIPLRRAGDNGPDGATREVLRFLRRKPATAALRPTLADALSAATEAGEEGFGAGELELRFADLADEYGAEDPGATVGGFLGWLASDPDVLRRDDDGVELATFHRAKGLEWPAVAVVGLEDGTVPLAHAVGASALAEERRLLYVALTRAETELWCSWAASAEGAGGARPRSPYLDDVARALGAAAAIPEPAEALTRVAELRRKLLLTA